MIFDRFVFGVRHEALARTTCEADCAARCAKCEACCAACGSFHVHNNHGSGDPEWSPNYDYCAECGSEEISYATTI